MSRPFQYKGSLGASKSLFNRALIVKSFYPDLQIRGQSQSQDVVDLERALWMWEQGLSQELDCGEGGTTLRFLLARVSRKAGESLLTGRSRLFERPHQDLLDGLHQLGVEVKRERSSFLIQSKGWQVPDQPIRLVHHTSSQFVSALLLSAWDLQKPLTLDLEPGADGPSWSYLQMTLSFLRSLGMVIEEKGKTLTVPPAQSCQRDQIIIEPDMSSAFALAACALGCGSIELTNFPAKSLQPDWIFIDLLKQIGAPISLDSSGTLKCERAQSLSALEVSLEQNPDLFPVLAVVLAQAKGLSRLSGLTNLRHKESDRLSNTQQLLTGLGYRTSLQNKVFLIEGEPQKLWPQPLFFEPDGDHRMAMAAAVARCFGAPITILHPEVVNKSFPEFWEILG